MNLRLSSRACRGTIAAIAVMFALTVLPGRGADEPYNVYAIISLTGPGSFIGRGEAVTLAAVERLANNTGGLRGRPIHFVVQDDESSASNAVQLLSQVQAKHVPVFIGPAFGATCVATLPLLANGPVGYCLSNVIHPPAGSYAFSANPSTKDFTAVGFRYLMAKGVRKLALLTSTDASGQDGESVALENLKNPEFRGLQVVANEHFAVGDLTVTAQLTRIKASGAQAIDAWTTGSPFGTVARGISEAAWDGILMTNAGNQSRAQMEQYSAYLPRQFIICTSPVYAIGQLPAAVRLARATWLDALHQSGIGDPDLPYNVGWDPAMIIVRILRQLGTDATAQQFRDALLKLHDYAGANGYYDYRRGDQRGIDPRASVVVTWDKGKHDFVTISKPGGLPL
jgi:branched-chain amino acid transport system substrate-binding protein